ncbi:MAG: hypothetical protein ABJO67_01100 [Pseudoruegeria sp.]
MKRRALVFGLVAWPFGVAAHSGHEERDLAIEVISSQREGNELLLSLALTNSTDETVTATEFYVFGARVKEQSLPLIIPAGGNKTTDVLFRFTTKIPDQFSLLILVGQGERIEIPIRP